MANLLITVSTDAKWLAMAKALTDHMIKNRMSTRSDLLVKVADGEAADKLPIAWHVPSTSDIVLNARKIKKFETAARSHSPARSLNSGLADAITSRDGDKLGDTEAAVWQRINGVLLHEAAHSKWSHFILEDWFQKANPKVAAAITQMDEIRIEAMQAKTSRKWRTALRSSSTMLLPSSKEIKDMADNKGSYSVYDVAMNSILSLGRSTAGILLDHEVKEMRHAVEDIVGTDRLLQMESIWSEFVLVPHGREERLMTDLAKQWLKLFEMDPDTDPSEDKPGESLSLPGLGDMLDEIMKAMGAKAEAWAENIDETHAPDECADASIEADKVFGEEEKSGGGHGYGSEPNSRDITKRPPSSSEQMLASAMAKRLEQLSTRARSEVTRSTIVPPGKLNTRAAVVQAADRAQGRATTATPWSRTVRKHNDNPPLKVGVITDISGSMRWAEEFVASASWILTKAVRHVNGKTATAVFGTSAEAIMGPGARIDNVIQRRANAGSEAFNAACAAVTGILGLDNSHNGVRILFVISDGFLVAPGEMQAASKWVARLTRSGAHVVWLTDKPIGTRHQGLPCVPKGAQHVLISDRTGGMNMKVIESIITAVTKSLAAAA